jgi:hypothetical protein
MKENAEYPLAASAEGAGLSGGQPQNYQSLKDRLGSAVMSTRKGMDYISLQEQKWAVPVLVLGLE